MGTVIGEAAVCVPVRAAIESMCIRLVVCVPGLKAANGCPQELAPWCPPGSILEQASLWVLRSPRKVWRML